MANRRIKPITTKPTSWNIFTTKVEGYFPVNPSHQNRTPVPPSNRGIGSRLKMPSDSEIIAMSEKVSTQSEEACATA